MKETNLQDSRENQVADIEVAKDKRIITLKNKKQLWFKRTKSSKRLSMLKLAGFQSARFILIRNKKFYETHKLNPKENKYKILKKFIDATLNSKEVFEHEFKEEIYKLTYAIRDIFSKKLNEIKDDK
jgi:hypothetical protein